MPHGILGGDEGLGVVGGVDGVRGCGNTCMNRCAGSNDGGSLVLCKTNVAYPKYLLVILLNYVFRGTKRIPYTFEGSQGKTGGKDKTYRK